MWSRKFRRTTLWLAACLAVFTGLGLARFGYRPSLFWCVMSAMAMLAMMRRRTLVSLLMIAGCCIVCSWWRGAVYMQKLEDYKALYLHQVSFTVQAMDDGVYGTHSQLTFDGTQIRTLDGKRLAGKVQISGFGLNGVFQGDEVSVSGKLYPGQGSYQSRVSFAKLSFVRHHPSLSAEVRRRFTAGMQNALPEPLASFAMGLLIGQRATLPARVKQDLLMVGLTHIIAVSGYNLTIILRASHGIFAKRSKRMSVLLSAALMGFFLLIAGSSASIIRAVIVSTLSMTASYYGRGFRPLNLILIAAAGTAFANPFYLWSDISWYLSFLAFYGVMVIGPLVAARMPKGMHESIVVQVGLESICAETMTLPIIVYMFGQMSFVGLVANVLVVGLIPLAMLLSAIAGLAGTFASAVAGWVSWPARLLLTYILDVSHLLAKIPHIFVQNLGLSLPQMLFMYALILISTAALWFKNKTKSVMITDKN